MGFTVEDVMTKAATTVDARLTAKQAAKTMAQRGVSGLAVTSRNKLAGFVTENDLVTQVMARGLSPERVKLLDLVSPPVTVVKPDSPLEYAVRFMLLQGITDLPVLGGELGEELVGVLSLSNVAMLYPGLYATLKQLQEKQPIPASRETNFYVC